MRTPASPLPLRILTYNIRYATTTPSPGEEPWPTRLPHLLAQLRFHTRHNPAALLCLQEALHHQLGSILQGLGPTWASLGVGRADGHQRGEFCPILYRADVWTVVRARTRWLSPTPDVPSRGWDAALPRVVTMGELRHTAGGVALAVFNTHLDDQGRVSRVEAARLLRAWVEECGREVVLAGDFNCEAGGEVWRVLTDGEGRGLVDLRTLVPREEWVGNEVTYTGFAGGKGQRIDFLLLRGFKGRDEGGEEEGEGGRVSGYAVLENRFDDGVFISDHRAVVGDVVLV
ncbi:MAG: hypothetical protein M1839_008886 [Geoglossum umbratile]|nr:MAG: hypothetical protein M1839_008886 [Geoglossum umbratile]